MKMNVKRILSCVLALSIFCMCTAIAASIPEISAYQYHDALKTEFSKYGIGFDITDLDEGFSCSRKFLDEQLALVKEYAESIKITEEPSDIPAPDVVPYVMPMPYLYVTSYTVKSDMIVLPGSCTFNLLIKGTVDIQNGNVINVSEFNFTKKTSGNLDSYSIGTKSATPNGSHVGYHVSGTCNFKYTNPKDNMLWETSVPFSFISSFDANDYTVG